MGNGCSQFSRKLPTSLPAFSDTLATEVPQVPNAEMAANSAAVENAEQSASAASRLGLTKEKISRLMNSFQDVQEFLFLAPRILERQKDMEAEMANFQRSRQAVSEDRVHISKGNVENISSSNRPSTLESEYHVFSDHDRLDAISIIEKSRLKRDEQNRDHYQLKDSVIACIIFEEAYQAALESKQCFLECMSSILTTAPKIGADCSKRKNSDPKERDFHAPINADVCKTTSLGQGVLNHLKVVMKETSDISDVSALVQEIENKLPAYAENGWFKDYQQDLFSKPEIKKYMLECCKYAWKLVCQTLPYVLGTDLYEKQSHPLFDSTRHEPCKDVRQPGASSGHQINAVIWPGLFVGSPPRVIRKTEVILKK